MGLGQEGWPVCSFQPSLRLEGKNWSPQPHGQEVGGLWDGSGTPLAGSGDIWQPSSQ